MNMVLAHHHNNGLEQIHSDFFMAQKRIYEPSGFVCTGVMKEAESSEYGACTFEMNKRRIAFRVGKITPTKIGQFVTLWKRIGNGPIMPFDMADPIDLFVVNVSCGDRFGQFVFPKAILCEKGIVSKGGIGGKRAMRIYPVWDKADNVQAKRTQAWQLAYFFEIPITGSVDISHVQRLFA
jgi:hypothetical protein